VYGVSTVDVTRYDLNVISYIYMYLQYEMSSCNDVMMYGMSSFHRDMRDAMRRVKAIEDTDDTEDTVESNETNMSQK
jgi:hypothetical protein